MAATTATKSKSEWVSTVEARRMLDGITYFQLQNIIRAGALTVRRYPGTYPVILRSDVERLARDSIRPAKIEA